MEYQPPPFFKQGPSARVRLAFFAFLALALLVADARFNALPLIREALASVLYPLQRATLFPTELLQTGSQYFVAISRLQSENETLKREKVALAQRALLAAQLQSENDQLRRLLSARGQQPLKSVAAEVLYDVRDSFSRKVIVDRGSSAGVVAGRPVIDDSGVVGQVTRVFPLSSEVTLVTDKGHAIPVQIVRSGARAVAFGGPESGRMELRFLASNADVQKDDVLVTSGLDGVYPSGLPVAIVERLDRAVGNAFAKIVCRPIAGIDRDRHVLILLTEKIALPPPPPEPRIPRRDARVRFGTSE
jgi:rod shape-determining protein MreC